MGTDGPVAELASTESERPPEGQPLPPAVTPVFCTREQDRAACQNGRHVGAICHLVSISFVRQRKGKRTALAIFAFEVDLPSQ